MTPNLEKKIELKRAVILFNMGGPGSLDYVEKFLFNIFNDKYMIRIPQPFRYLLAKFISKKRVNFAKDIYSKIGGKSPILEETQKQAMLLEEALGENYKTFVVMRYSFPFIKDIIPQISEYSPDEIILLPLYPQYCSCTTLSSFKDIKNSLPLPLRERTKDICCYYNNSLFIEAHTLKILEYYNLAKEFGKPRILFSAHGIPQQIIDKGDPYEFQINETVNNIIAQINKVIDKDDFEWIICYQSKVGRLKWLDPSTEDIIKKFANEVLVIVPIAFTSEHSETLVELDVEYKHLSKNKYFRVPTLSCDAKFIECLKHLCENEFQSECSNCTKMCYMKL